MKKVLYLMGVAALIVAVIGIIVLIKRINKEEYPRIVYIDDNSYYDSEEICETVPRKAPDGIIETFTSPEIMPDSYNSANFGSEYKSLEYMFLEDGRLIVHIGENWYYFR